MALQPLVPLLHPLWVRPAGQDGHLQPRLQVPGGQASLLQAGEHPAHFLILNEPTPNFVKYFYSKVLAYVTKLVHSVTDVPLSGTAGVPVGLEDSQAGSD